MRRTVLALLATALAAGPAAADFFPFTGSIAIPETSRAFLPLNASFAGSGIGVSSRTPTNEIHSFGAVVGFTGTETTSAWGTGAAPFIYSLEVTAIGDPSFKGTGPLGKLKGKMAVHGIFRIKRIFGTPLTTFPLTRNGTEGFGLGGTLSGWSAPPFDDVSSIRFGTWTTGTVAETLVNTGMELSPQSGTISAKGFDTRTALGMGTCSSSRRCGWSRRITTAARSRR